MWEHYWSLINREPTRSQQGASREVLIIRELELKSEVSFNGALMEATSLNGVLKELVGSQFWAPILARVFPGLHASRHLL